MKRFNLTSLLLTCVIASQTANLFAEEKNTVKAVENKETIATKASDTLTVAKNFFSDWTNVACTVLGLGAAAGASYAGYKYFKKPVVKKSHLLRNSSLIAGGVLTVAGLVALIYKYRNNWSSLCGDIKNIFFDKYANINVRAYEGKKRKDKFTTETQRTLVKKSLINRALDAIKGTAKKTEKAEVEEFGKLELNTKETEEINRVELPAMPEDNIFIQDLNRPTFQIYGNSERVREGFGGVKNCPHYKQTEEQQQKQKIKDTVVEAIDNAGKKATEQK